MIHDPRLVGPLVIVDQAFVIVRRAGFRHALLAWAGGLALGVPVLVTLYLDRVEGFRVARPAFASALVAGWLARSLLLSRAARIAASSFDDRIPIPKDAGKAANVSLLASVVGFGFSLWVCVLGLAAAVTPMLGAVAFFAFALRGAVAPSWIARAACTADSGIGGFIRACGDTAGRRASGFANEFLVQLGAAVVLVNLAAGLGVLTLLARSMLALDVASLETFFSLRNSAVLVVLAALALVLLEPLRTARSAIFYVLAVRQREGVDLRAAVDNAVARKVLVVSLLLVLASPNDTWAQAAQAPKHVPSVAVNAPATKHQAFDVRVRSNVDSILARKEFQDVEKSIPPWSSGELWARFLKWLFPQRDSLSGPSMHLPSLPLPPVGVFVALALIFAGGVLAYLWFSSALARRPKSTETSTTEEGVTDPRDREPEAHLDDAAVLASQGRLREALRSLYLATLVALDRRRLIVFDPALTNWSYIRSMPIGETRQLFSRFTRVFDRKWYGREATTMEEVEQCRGLAERICAPPEET